MTKNRILIAIVSVLLIGVGISMAYFAAKVSSTGGGISTEVTTAKIGDVTIEMYGKLDLDVEDMYPGHSDVSRLDVKATGDNRLVAYNLVWAGTNSLQTKIEYIVYRVTNTLEVSSACEVKTKIIEEGQAVYEECKINNIDKLGSPVGSGTIETGEEILVEDEFINASPTGEEIHYYVVLTYPNKEEDQDYDRTGEFSGEIKITNSDAKPDITILAAYVEDEKTGKFNEAKKIPEGEYKLNNRSTCTNGATPIWDTNNKGLLVANLTETGTSCVLYFEKKYASDDMLAKLEAARQAKFNIEKMPNPLTGPYSGDASSDQPIANDKLYTSPDNYGRSYVFRGNNYDVHNWVTFAGHTWRIIRINGDGTLRLIYQCATPGCTTTEGEGTHIGTSIYKSEAIDDNTYVGYYYGEPGQETYDATHTNAHQSTIAKYISDWYSGTGAMTNYTKYLSGDTGWCNDRTAVKNFLNGYEGDGTGKTLTGYALSTRLIAKGGAWRLKQYPTLKCGAVMPEENPTEEEGAKYFSNFEVDNTALKRDLYTTIGSSNGNKVLDVPAALVTTDEVAMAGGFGGTASTNYWLYTNQYYWAMSSWGYFSEGFARAWVTQEGGALWGAWEVRRSYGVRPVINLNADVTFSGGTGTSSNPFVVNTSN